MAAAKTLRRQTDGKLRHDGSSGAFVQPEAPVAERGRPHGASELDLGISDRDVEYRFVYYRTLEDDLRCCKGREKYDRLRWQDKRPHIARRLGGCVSMGYAKISQRVDATCTLRR